MSQIKQLLKLHLNGTSIKGIARTLHISRNTVKAYLHKVQLTQCNIEELLSFEDHELETRLHVGNAAYKQNRYDRFKDHLEYFARELKRTGVTRHLLWEEYKHNDPDCYSYTQFCHHLGMYITSTKPTMVLDHQPGDKLYVDFAGKKMAYTDPSTGEEIACEVFVACLPYSDYGFALAIPSQSIEDFIFALNTCLLTLGGVPLVLVPDNFKAAIIKAHRYEPTVNRALDDFANHYGMAIIPARVRKPRDKALVENHVKIIYNRVYAKLRNQKFFSLKALNKAICEKMREHNQTRMQQQTYCREECFLSEEKPLLKPLPGQVFELKYYSEHKVAKNNYISLNKRYYSVPYSYIGQKVKAISTRSMVAIYSKGKQLAVHVFDPQKKYNTIPEHLCSHHQHYLSRSPQWYTDQARKKSKQLHLLIRYIFGTGRHPEECYRACDGLFSLWRKSDPQAFEQACTLALEHGNHSYYFIENILNNKMNNQQEALSSKPLPKHSNIRGKDFFS